jgi:hypothetical protein
MSWSEASQAAKSKNLLFADSFSKKGQAKLALFWRKGEETPWPDGVCVGATRVLIVKPTPV